MALNQSGARQPLLANNNFTILSDHHHPLMQAGMAIQCFLQHVSGVGLMMLLSHRPGHRWSFIKEYMRQHFIPAIIKTKRPMVTQNNYRMLAVITTDFVLTRNILYHHKQVFPLVFSVSICWIWIFTYSAHCGSKGTGERRSLRAKKQPPPASSAHNWTN